MSAPPASSPAGATPWHAYACLATSMALVGSYVGFSKALVAVLPIFLLAWLRFGIAAIAMAPWLRRPADEPPLDRATRRLLFLESFFGNFLFSICMLAGIARSSALAAGVVMAGIPAAVALLSWGWLGERIPPRTLAGIGCAVGGIALVSIARHDAGGASGEDSQGAWIGHALLVGATLCEATYIVIGKRLVADVGPKRVSALINLWGLALVTPFGLWQLRGFDFGAVTVSTWGLLTFYALAASVVTVWLWMKGLRHVPAARAGVFTVLLPTAAAAVGVVLLGERLGGAEAAAFALALAGVVLATWPSRGGPTRRLRPTGPRPLDGPPG